RRNCRPIGTSSLESEQGLFWRAGITSGRLGAVGRGSGRALARRALRRALMRSEGERGMTDQTAYRAAADIARLAAWRELLIQADSMLSAYGHGRLVTKEEALALSARLRAAYSPK